MIPDFVSQTCYPVLVTCLLLSVILLQFAFVGQPSSRLRLESLRSAPEARQGVAVDGTHFYAIDSRSIGKYNKKTGERSAIWEAPKDSRIIHLDSGVVVDGKLYCAHSNYPGYPMTSSVEIWDTQTLTHMATHDFGVRWGSMTWLDRHDGFWWAVYANYDTLIGPNQTRYGGKENTVLVKLNDHWEEVQSWTYPANLLTRFDQMSNSGGSWGPDGRLYLTGHDADEVYAVRLPETGGTLELLETIEAPIGGQGIAWDRASYGLLYGVKRSNGQVTVSRLTPSR